MEDLSKENEFTKKSLDNTDDNETSSELSKEQEELMKQYQAEFENSDFAINSNMVQAASMAGKRNYKTYQNKKDKAEDVKASAITLFLVGGVGLIADLLVVFDVTPIHFNLSGKIITCGTMAILFLCMIIFGFVSVKSIKGLRTLAKEEDQLTEEIEKWYHTELSKDIIEDGLFVSEEEINMPEELKYFKRSQKIRVLLNQKFMNLEQSYSENLIEKIYQEYFE